jgi:putative flippase GtrA
MKPALSRFAVVGASITACDVGCFVLLRAAGLALVLADAAAIVVASLLSYWLHRAITFAHDPYHRWLDEAPGAFVRSSVVALVVDVAVVVVLGAVVGGGLGAEFGAKLVAVAVAGAVRWSLHRGALFRVVQADRVPKPGRSMPDGPMRLSVVIPAYYEEDGIGEAIAKVRAAMSAVAAEGLEIVVVDDGSPDGTADAARAGGADQVVVQPRNRGKGAAVRAGVAVARGRAIAFTDADLAYPPEQLAGLLAEVEAGWDMVVGSRQHANTVTLARARRLREVGGRVINWVTYVVVLGRYRDTQCGIKAFRSDVARSMFERARVDGFAFDIELFVIAERDRLAVTEVPVHVQNTERSTVKVVRDAVRVVRDVFRIRRWARRGDYEPRPARPAEAATADQ